MQCNLKETLAKRSLERTIWWEGTGQFDEVRRGNVMKENEAIRWRETKENIERAEILSQNVIKWENLIGWNLFSSRFVLEILSRLVLYYQIASFLLIKLFSQAIFLQKSLSNCFAWVFNVVLQAISIKITTNIVFVQSIYSIHVYSIYTHIYDVDYYH
jgi:hypothetical protein